MISPDEWDRYRTLFGSPEYLSRIKAAEGYATRLLPFISRGLPVFQSHGIIHSLAIIRNINQIIREPILQVRPNEIFLLFLATWFHDLGYLHPASITNRGMHPMISVDMIRKDPVIRELVREEELWNLEIIIQYHDTHADLTLIQDLSPSLRTSLLAAIFRLADAVDIGTDRCPPELYSLIEDGLDDHSRKHWLAHQNILNCVIEYPVIRIQVYDLENLYFRERIISHIDEDCQSSAVIFERYGFAPMMAIYQKTGPELVSPSS